MANYGITYMGSKASIVHKICSIFPRADNFYDIFGGGFSVTHYMISHRAKQYERFYYNEPAPGVCDLIRDAIAGKFNYHAFKPPFVNRDEFFKKKGACAYTRIMWSFGNSQHSYLFGKDIEAYKEAFHNAVVFNQFNDITIKALGIIKFPDELSIISRRLFVRRRVKDRMGELQQLQQLERLERLERLELLATDYREVMIRPNSIVYCDPPYKSTTQYLESFDHVAFWEWVRSNDNPIFVSEYTAPPDIKPIMAIRKKSRLSSISPTDSVEKLFGNDMALKLLRGHK